MKAVSAEKENPCYPYQRFRRGLARYGDNARRMLLHRERGNMKWKQDAERFIQQVEEAFCDRERNFRRWLALEKCVFRHPCMETGRSVVIGDDPESIYAFLLFCQRLNGQENPDTALVSWIQTLLDRQSGKETEEESYEPKRTAETARLQKRYRKHARGTL